MLEDQTIVSPSWYSSRQIAHRLVTDTDRSGFSPSSFLDWEGNRDRTTHPRPSSSSKECSSSPSSSRCWSPMVVWDSLAADAESMALLLPRLILSDVSFCIPWLRSWSITRTKKSKFVRIKRHIVSNLVESLQYVVKFPARNR